MSIEKLRALLAAREERWQKPERGDWQTDEADVEPVFAALPALLDVAEAAAEAVEREYLPNLRDALARLEETP